MAAFGQKKRWAEKSSICWGEANKYFRFHKSLPPSPVIEKTKNETLD